MSTSEQTSASNGELIEALKYALERIRDFDPKGDEYLSKLLERPSPQQLEAITIDNIANRLFKTDYKYIGLDSCKVQVLEEYILAGQPDELLKAQARIRKLEAVIKSYQSNEQI